MSCRRTTLLRLLMAAHLVVGIRQTTRAQTAGDPVTVQFGNYLSPTAFGVFEAFSISANFPLFPQHFSFDYAASPFDAATDGTIEIKSFTFFNNQQSSRVQSTNVFDVFMSAGSGPLSFFGQFLGVSPLCGFFLPACVPNCFPVSMTCLPLGAGAGGSFFYDPSLGGLHIEMFETHDIAANTFGDPLFWHDQYASGGSGLVTRFDGVVAAPEPTSLSLLATGIVILIPVITRRRRPRHLE
jgi:hypothetical protein